MALLLGSAGMAAADDLMGLYGLAQQRDPGLRAAAAGLEATKEVKPQAMAGLLPQIGAGATTHYTDVNVHGRSAGVVDGDYTGYDVGVSLVQPLYRRDRLMRLEQADWVVEQADAEYTGAVQDLALRVSEAYFGVLGAQEGLVFAQAEKTAIKHQLNQAQQRFEVGLIAITGVHEAQARYDNSVAQEIVAQNNLDAAWEALREIIGDRPEQLAALIDELPLEPPSPADIDQWSSMALANNPGVQAASYATQVAQKEIDAQYSGHFPTLDLVGSYGTADNDDEDGFRSDTARIALELNVPIYTGGAVSSQTREARQRLTQAQEVLDQRRRAVDRQVRDAYRTVHASISAVEALKAGKVSAASALEATEAGFDVGTRTMVDVLDAQRDFYRAERDYATARYTYVLQSLRLKRAAGMLADADLAKVNTWLR